MKPWHRLLSSQLLLAGIALALCAMVRRGNFSAHMILGVIAETVLYAGWVLPLAGSARADKIAPWLVGCGAWLMMSNALCRGFDINSLPASMAVYLSVPGLIVVVAAATYGLVRTRH